ncbi:glycoside hydrolase family 6 protein [Pseudonocardia sp. TRM90224]|uniref:glycoside hydrolase family 6 protein n=1 Tax=Pseudonocardia sp. TRM90224 TaxID=2812678 RepID=UPI001E59A769|nr:glycoside hydrolase family 6 protein [Pseudonocardia sp. TRM90224]
MSRRPTSSIIARRISPLLAGALLVVAAGCTTAPPTVTNPPASTGTVQPSTGLYVEPDAPAARQATQWESEGRTADAEKMRKMAAEPIAHWLTKPTGHIGADVADYVGKAKAAGARPLLVAYHIPNRDCGSFSGGGADDADDYRAWIREVAENLGDSRAMIVVEPDAVPHELGECVDEEGERSGLLSDAVEVLKGAGATVYLDAGNPGFIPDVGALAGALKNSGVGKADGFSLNVANFYPTDTILEYGRNLSNALGGTHFVVDTGRNGNGRAEGHEVDGGPAWCNPPGRALGQAPTTDTGEPLADAFLWIKRVGESDGSCRPGEPDAGKWWPEYALGLAERAKS